MSSSSASRQSPSPDQYTPLSPSTFTMNSHFNGSAATDPLPAHGSAAAPAGPSHLELPLFDGFGSGLPPFGTAFQAPPPSAPHAMALSQPNIPGATQMPAPLPSQSQHVNPAVPPMNQSALQALGSYENREPARSMHRDAAPVGRRGGDAGTAFRTQVRMTMLRQTAEAALAQVDAAATQLAALEYDRDHWRNAWTQESDAHAQTKAQLAAAQATIAMLQHPHRAQPHP